jgi:hypothetical protein
MISTLSACGILALSLLGVTNAHMIMASPVPFDVANINNSPLAADGSDFPCKVNPGGMSAYSYTVTAMNEIPVDKPILLSFDGSAIHGGGTCQLSITFDAQPTKESVFKVIQTFEGGECPKPTGSGLTFNIPKEFPNAENATLAWTWFNRVGNREMYMNCAPISITGGSDSKDYYGSLPDMLVANVPATDCRTEDGKDAQAPNPGAFVLQSTDLALAALSGAKCPAEVQTNNAKSGTVTNLASLDPPATDNNKVVPVAGGAGSSGASPSVPAVGGGGNDGMYTPPVAAPSQPSATAPSQPSPTAATPNNGLYSQPAVSAAPSPTSSIAASAPAPTASAPTASAPAASHTTFQTFTIPASSAATPSSSAAAPPAYPTLSPSMGQGVSGPSSGGSTASPTGSSSSSSSSSPSNGSAANYTTCTTEGSVVCNGTDQFGLCNHGSVVWQKVASGTTCSNGSIQKRSSANVHVRRHAHGAFRVRSS